MRLPRLWRKPITVRTCDIDVLVWVGGDPERTGEALGRTLAELRAELPEAFVSFLVDGPEWETALEEWRSWFPDRRELRLPIAAELPALLFGMAIAGSAHPWTAFLWPGCGVDGEGLRRLREAAQTGDGLVYGDPVPPVPAELSHPVQPGWLQMADLVPMHHCLLARQVGETLRFDDSPRSQRSFWRDFTLCLSREGRLRHVPAAAPPLLWSWESFPFRRVFRDLRDPAGERPLKVVLLSGLLDSHQNQLFFYNFAAAAPAGVLDLRTVLYERCRPEDLAGCDLAIFSRPRFPAVPALLDLCRTAGIPTLVMIDDNWIAAGRELPRFERLFTPDKPAFEVFLDSLRRADAVLVFNPVLAEEVRPWARRVLELPPNVDFSSFAAPEAAPGSPFLVGFAGSPRFEETGFRGFVRFLGRHLEARLLVMAHEVPEPLRGVPAERLTFLPWRHDYAAYARDLAAQRPDVLLAPLDASRFSASKIPIKFLEAAAVGAAGIYSRLPPYTEHVRDGETGLLVENREEAWEAALERLHGDPELRRRIARNAAAEVRERFATGRVLPAFLALLHSVASGKAKEAG
jgi:glycosyltransferase involved in cell wall biosynthesis